MVCNNCNSNNHGSENCKPCKQKVRKRKEYTCCDGKPNDDHLPGGTFYRPGETLGLLETYFKELKEKNNLAVKISDENVFCLDNEAFRFCCAYFGRIKFDQSDIEDLADSWKKSKEEISRFLEYASRLRPQSTAEVLSINETRTWILQLVSPAIKVSDIIQTNFKN